MSFPFALPCSDLVNNNADAVIVIAADVHDLHDERLNKAVAPYLAVDARISSKATLVLADELPGKRLIVSPTGPLNRDYDDVRRIFDAAKSAISEAKAAGCKAPVLHVVGMPKDVRYQNALQVAYLGACQALWQPLEAREYRGQSIEPMTEISMLGADETLCKQLNAIAAGQYAARDLCGTEPERMAPPKFADYCVELFAGTSVSVDIISDINTIEQQYPMLGTVARASYAVERHHPRVVKLVYTPSDEVKRTLMFVGKGLVYDTGGADLKVGGFMAGMSRDKGGAASVAGFMKAVADYQPAGVKVIAYLAVVRNSIGSDCFVPDEIITCREGLKVRIGNTDAEGRLAMGDLLSEMKELAKSAINPELFTVATLTGHAARAVGPYSAYVENGPARAMGVSRQLADIGDLWGDGAELSRSRREDYDFVKPRTLADDVLSSNNAPSAVTARGHQFPMAFLAIVGGIDKHGSDSDLPLPYVHMDIAGSGVEGGDWQHGKPTAATVSSLFARYCL
ncbi:cytosol aminopeptidase [Pseudoalteromonas holothuriae]|uniref:Cytosol aminopeptidase n=1 Tax=Pseudoalteromonas holothuriae TaxID=2963714 RepID=A0A9W4W031_9GAMM|nr:MULTISPECIES: leucyl aminopeptidase family protein [unclassified Pseudoalteromonas]CAH9049469.1 cytosol aminopeptidase [Pseudoalteromonas sp. CIP111854]CAH9055806.1 cytosol aminopeptidase [Pseudoalteromonas sp. CIP111951]